MVNRVKTIEELLEKTAKKSRSNTAPLNMANTLKDWVRMGGKNTFYFNHLPVFSPEDLQLFTDTEALEPQKQAHALAIINDEFANIDPDIANYIFNYAHQNGFLNASFTATKDLLFGREINPSDAERRFDFIQNADGSITFIEEISIDSAEYINSSQFMQPVNVTLPGNRFAKIITESVISIDQNKKVHHTLKTDKIILLDPAAETFFNSNDAIILEKPYQTIFNDAFAALKIDFSKIKNSANPHAALSGEHEEALSVIRNIINPNEHETGLFPNVKIALKDNFLIFLLDTLMDEKALVDAFNTRESITKNGKKYNAFTNIAEIKKALEAIDAKNNAEYDIYDPTRLGTGLQKAGFNKFELESLNLSEILIWEAIIASTHQKILVDINKHYLPLYADDVRDAEADLADQKTFEKNLYEMAGNLMRLQPALPLIIQRQPTTDLNMLNQACKELFNISKEKSESPLGKLGMHAAYRIKKAQKDGLISAADLPMITQYTRVMTAVVNNPNDYNIAKHKENTQKVFGFNRKWKNIIGGAMLSFFGAIMVTASIGLAVATFGISTPLSAIGLSLGTTLIASGVMIGLAGAGVALSIKGGMFAHESLKGKLVVIGEQVTEEAEQLLKNKKT